MEGSVAVSPEDLDKIGQVCYEANRAYCLTIGDATQAKWTDAAESAKRSARVGVQAVADNPASTPMDSHLSWMTMKREEGWVWGAVKNEAKKEHPCMLPYEELPLEQRVKDRLFLAVARSLLPDLPPAA